MTWFTRKRESDCAVAYTVCRRPSRHGDTGSNPGQFVWGDIVNKVLLYSFFFCARIFLVSNITPMLYTHSFTVFDIV